MTNLNNKKLKKLLKSKSRVKIEQNPDMFYKEFLKSEVFVPVIAMENEESLIQIQTNWKRQDTKSSQ